MSETKRKVRIGPLNTLGGVLTEMGRVYRSARRGDLESQEATRLTYVLSQMRGVIEASEFERRLEALEQKDRAQ